MSSGPRPRDSGNASAGRGTQPGNSPRPKPDRRRRRTARRRRIILLAVAALIALLGAGTALAFVGNNDDLAPGAVSVEGVDVSGMDAAEVRKVVRTRARERMRDPIVITRDDGSGFEATVSARELGAQPRVGEATRAALDARGPVGRVLDRIGMAPGRDVSIGFTLDEKALDKLVANVNDDFDDPPRASTVKVTGGDITVVPGRAGVGIDEAELRRRIAELPDRIELAVGRQEAPVSDAVAEAARQRALAIVSAPVRITLQGRGVAIQPAVLRSALRFAVEPPDIAVSLDPTVLYADIGPAFEAREIPARDAAFQVRGDTVRLIPSAAGRRLDMDTIARSIAALPETRSVRARFEVSQPEVLTAELSGLGIKELVSEFSTGYSCCEPRVTNIQTAAKTLDGTIVPAGNRFSLNDALGARTEDRGYVAAPQIAGGKLEDAVGGGVSQVSTTLYNAAFFAGLDLESHTPHSFYISRYPMGREATLSMGGPELVFRNDWDAAILMSVTAGDNDVTVRFFSSKLGRRVETTTGEPRDYVEPEEKEELDTSLEPGTREVEQSSGGAGFTIDYTRTVYENDEVRSERTFTWTYSPKNAYIKVGPEPTTTTTETDGDDVPPPSTTTPDDAPDDPPESEPEPQPDPAPDPAPSGGGAPPPPLP